MAKKKKKKGTKPRRAVQQNLPGTTIPKNPTIERLAKKYVEARDERMSAGKREVQEKTLLLREMENAGATVYEDAEADLRVAIVTKKKSIKVSKLSESDDDDDGSNAPDSPDAENPDKAEDATPDAGDE